MGVYLRVLAVVYAFGAIVHYANLLGIGEQPWSQMPLTWQIGDVAYALLDTATVIGLWLRTPWGVGCFLLGAVSQLILYGAFPQLFAFTEEHRQALNSLIVMHLVALTVFFGLLVARK